jgi:predicted dithiol-disulfide oxidoreductase (DUF899 family)
VSHHGPATDRKFPVSARDAGAGLLAGRGFGWLGCYVRDDHDRVYETYWTTGRGNEAGFWSYGLLDRTVFGRQEPWEDSNLSWRPSR